MITNLVEFLKKYSNVDNPVLKYGLTAVIGFFDILTQIPLIDMYFTVWMIDMIIGIVGALIRHEKFAPGKIFDSCLGLGLNVVVFYVLMQLKGISIYFIFLPATLVVLLSIATVMNTLRNVVLIQKYRNIDSKPLELISQCVELGSKKVVNDLKSKLGIDDKSMNLNACQIGDNGTKPN